MLEKWFKAIYAFDYTPDKPVAYGFFHLIFTVVGFAVCIFLAIKLKKVKGKTADLILFGCGAFLLITEVYKQLFYYYCMDINAVRSHWWIFPFQLCSIPMYLCLLLPFLKEGRFKRALYTFMATYNLLGGFMAFIEPSGIIHNNWPLTLHACIWHMLLNFIGFFIISKKLSGRTKKEFAHAIIVFAVLAVVAFIINLALRDVSDGSVNMFYVGPSNSPLAVFSTICEKFGWQVNTVLYLLSLTFGAFIFFLVPYLYDKKRGKKA